MNNKKEWKELNELYIVFFHDTPYFFNNNSEWADYEHQWEKIYQVPHLSMKVKKNLEFRINGYKIEIWTYVKEL